MKTKLKVMALIIIASATAIIISCSKEENNSSVPTEAGNNLRTGSEKLEAMTGSCSSSQDGDMYITWGTNNAVSITSRKSGANPSGKFKATLFDISVNLSSGQFTIPNDGNAYWFVPFDSSSSPQRMKAGVSMEVQCNCKGSGSCVLKGTALASGGSQFQCESNTCTDCCEMVIKETTGGGNVCVGSGVLLMADVLTFNGITYNKTDNFYYLASYVGTCASPGKTEVYLHQRGSDVIFRNLDNSSVNITEFRSIIFDLTVSNGKITIPNDGKKYWFIPFDNGQSAQRLYGGTDVDLKCECDGGTGNCRGKTTISGNTTTHTCQEDGCNACCKLSFTIGGSTTIAGGGVVIAGDHLTQNGTLYQ